LPFGLSTGQRAALFSSRIDSTYKLCGLLENDFHLLFECTFSRAVWFSANPPLRTDLIPHEDAGLDDTLQALLSNNYTNELLQEILTRLWYIWKARNDFRFNDKKWSISKLCHEVNADIFTC